MKYAVIDGQGSPSNPAYTDVIGTLHAFSYTLKMLPKKGIVPEGYFDYSIFPLEGFWHSEDGGNIREGLNKDKFVYRMMIRQPDFLSAELFQKILKMITKKVDSEMIKRLKIETITEGHCVQMMHIGPYNKEYETFDIMDSYCEANGLERVNNVHKEIYLSDSRRIAPEKLRTALRYQVKDSE
ncbi:hypothetical protein AZF37_07615 [endosymbiont 'TC1' of Trimyema compressum]|nr:hypothetical protein AZF37_07615 [endosymbiont 'TC1' of Trimyema compressum]